MLISDESEKLPSNLMINITVEEALKQFVSSSITFPIHNALLNVHFLCIFIGYSKLSAYNVIFRFHISTGISFINA